MTELNYTLVSDGTSDRALIPIINWLIRHNGYDGALEGTCVDYRLFQPLNTGNRLADRILYALKYFPCELLFVHRDSERKGFIERTKEITEALEIVFRSNPSIPNVPNVPIIPVRMTEAWLLIQEDAIRYAAGNLSGLTPIILPELNTLEHIPQPKTILHELIVQASGLNARRRRTFIPERFVHRVTEYIDDFTLLRSLPAFRALETYIANTLHAQSWIANIDCFQP